MEPVRRVVILVTFELLEAALALDSAELKIVEILPKRPHTYVTRQCEIVIEGPCCPVVCEGEHYPTRQLIAYNLPDGSRRVELL